MLRKFGSRRMVAKTHFLCLLLILLAANVCFADEWDGDDKQLHAIAGAVIGLSGYAIHDMIQPEARERSKWLSGWLAGTGAGVAKELYDWYDYGRFSGKDLAVASAGAAIGAMLGVGITYVDSTLTVTRFWRW